MTRRPRLGLVAAGALLAGCGLADGSSRSSSGAGAGGTGGSATSFGGAGFGGGTTQGGSAGQAGAGAQGGVITAGVGGTPVGGDGGTSASPDCTSDEAFTIRKYMGGSSQVVADDEHVYWKEGGGCLEWRGSTCVGGYLGRLYRSDHCGERVELLVDWEIVGSNRLRLDDRAVYMVTRPLDGTTTLWALDKIGLGRTEIATGAIWDLFVWQGDVYWIADRTGMGAAPMDRRISIT